MAEEIDLEKCNFWNFRSSVTWSWPWIGSKSYWCEYLIEVYPHTKLDRNRKNFSYGRTDSTYGRTDRPEFQFINSSLGDDVIKQELIRRWDSERQLIYDDVVHAEASAYARWTDFLISKDVRVPASLYYTGLQATARLSQCNIMKLVLERPC